MGCMCGALAASTARVDLGQLVSAGCFEIPLYSRRWPATAEWAGAPSLDEMDEDARHVVSCDLGQAQSRPPALSVGDIGEDLAHLWSRSKELGRRLLSSCYAAATVLALVITDVVIPLMDEAEVASSSML